MVLPGTDVRARGAKMRISSANCKFTGFALVNEHWFYAASENLDSIAAQL